MSMSELFVQKLPLQLSFGFFLMNRGWHIAVPVIPPQNHNVFGSEPVTCIVQRLHFRIWAYDDSQSDAVGDLHAKQLIEGRTDGENIYSSIKKVLVQSTSMFQISHWIIRG